MRNSGNRRGRPEEAFGAYRMESLTPASAGTGGGFQGLAQPGFTAAVEKVIVVDQMWPQKETRMVFLPIPSLLGWQRTGSVLARCKLN